MNIFIYTIVFLNICTQRNRILKYVLIIIVDLTSSFPPKQKVLAPLTSPAKNETEPCSFPYSFAPGEIFLTVCISLCGTEPSNPWPKNESWGPRNIQRRPMIFIQQWGCSLAANPQMNLHGYRYGRARFDFFPLPFSEKRRRTVLNQDSSNNVDGCDNLSCFLIKDLRTKCVFPNGLSYNSCFEPKKFEEGSVEESAQSTPPDIDLFVDTKEAEENGNPNVGFLPEKQSNKIDQKNSRIKSVRAWHFTLFFFIMIIIHLA